MRRLNDVNNQTGPSVQTLGQLRAALQLEDDGILTVCVYK